MLSNFSASVRKAREDRDVASIIEGSLVSEGVLDQIDLSHVKAPSVLTDFNRIDITTGCEFYGPVNLVTNLKVKQDTYEGKLPAALEALAQHKIREHSGTLTEYEAQRLLEGYAPELDHDDPIKQAIKYRKDTLLWMSECYINSPDGDDGISKMVPYDYQKRLILDQSPLRIVLKARQTGISQTVALEALHDCIYNDHYTVLFISKTQGDAINLLNSVALAWTEGCPRPPGLELMVNNRTELRFSNGSRIKSIPASKGAGRSFTANAVYIDEAAFQQWDKEIYRSIKPTTSRGGRIVVLSTPNGRANNYYQLWSGDLGKNYSHHFIPWWDCPAYLTPEEQEQINRALEKGEFTQEELKYDAHYRKYCAWFALNRDDLTDEMWASEYGCDFRQSGGAVFDEDDVEAVFHKQLRFEAPVANAEYVSFWDIGQQDATVGTTFRIIRTGTKIIKRIVAWERFQHYPFQAIANKVDERTKKYPGTSWVESNNTGKAVIELCRRPVSSHFTDKNSKVEMILALQLDLQQNRIESPEIARLREEMLGYQWDDKGIIQDCVMSISGACYRSSSKGSKKVRPRAGGQRPAIAAYVPS